MILISNVSDAERSEVMVWAAGNGPQTAAVRRFLLCQRMTFGIALITRSDYGSLELAKWN